MLRSYKGSAADVVIPAEVNGLPVTQIGDSAFTQNETLRSVVIPEGVTIIGKDAFRNCYKLETVVLPRSLHTIRDNAFRSCSSLTSINLEYVSNLEYFCLASCYSLTGVFLLMTTRTSNPSSCPLIQPASTTLTCLSTRRR